MMNDECKNGFVLGIDKTIDAKHLRIYASD
jgi:hypothetical protein